MGYSISEYMGVYEKVREQNAFFAFTVSKEDIFAPYEAA